ncbi:hypothetical protein GCM10025862_37600 [Arsenicicoccus piscis]|uniref:Uncharacterized protein n=1 Tax=Arsenicicoccus piscis TaxID=673954 RepID=A0ABQ6HW17_9MICO|nr:hypothetical protein GCM10025862_37600 [Arsenicicoccus piscis]
MRPTTAAPDNAHLFMRARGLIRTAAMATAASRTRTKSLFQHETPATAPTATHQVGLSRSARKDRTMTTCQANRSRVAVTKTWPIRSGYTVKALDQAASR